MMKLNLMIIGEAGIAIFEEGFMESPPVTIPWWVFGVVFAFIGIGVLVYFGWRHYQEKAELNEQHAVFYGVCERFEIPLEDRTLLEEIAESEKLVSPLVLLMSGKTMDHHFDKFLNRQPEARHREIKQKAKAMREKVFT